jgi:hypothetical protein
MANHDAEHWRLRLVELIATLELSQRVFADQTGIDPSYVSRLLYEPGKKGRKNLGLANMTAIRKRYKLPAGWFEMPLGAGLEQLKGWDATPLSDYSATRQQRIEHAVKAMEQMTDYQVDQAVKIIDTLAQPQSKNGTSG